MINLSEKLFVWKDQLLPFKSMRKLVKPNKKAQIMIENNDFTVLQLAGLTVGDPVLRTRKPLSVELGPGKLFAVKSIEHICDEKGVPFKKNDARYYGHHF